FGGGGSVRNLKILEFLKNRFELDVIPSIPGNVAHGLSESGYAKKLVSVIEGYGFSVPTVVLDILKSSPQRKKYTQLSLISKIVKEIKNKYNLVYSMSELPSDLLLALKIRSEKRAYLSQGLWFTNNLYNDIKLELKTEYYTPFTVEFYKRITLRSLFRNASYFLSKKFDAILTINRAHFEMNGLNKKVDNSKIKLIYPGNATSVKPTQPVAGKENYVVHFGRLHPTKGLFIVPRILREVRDRVSDIKLVIFGKFTNEKIKVKFFERINSYHLRENVEYLGFLREDEMLKVISKAKVLIFPTLVDIHPLSVLDALALGTAVISLDIPTMRWLYDGIKPVSLCNSYECMATEVKRFMEMDSESYIGMFRDSKTVKFIEDHSDWSKVAQAELKTIEGLLNENLHN
ncbi:MAG: glycosyltransferase family 4 protein, partial [Infirmifilum sp.]